MTTAANGYPVLDSDTTGPLPRLRKWTIPGTGRHLLLRDGSAGFILVHLALWFHERIERLDLGQWDEWGWAPRPIRGGTVPSTHAAGMAEDLNSTRHPRGIPTARTYTNRQRYRIRRRLAWYNTLAGAKIIDWGGNWPSHPASTALPDGMHFEAVGPFPAIENLARYLTHTPRGRRILDANPGAKEVIYS